MRQHTSFIVVHCAFTKPTMDIGVDEIRQWHLARGWNDIGYHSVIRRNGEIEEGRDYHAVGAHVKGYNSDSVGVCLVGGMNKYGDPEANFTNRQWKALKRELQWLKTLFPDAMIVGHRDLTHDRDCPCFDVREWLKQENMLFLL